MTTRVAVISDTHLPRGGRALPAACVRELEAADLVLHAGDFTAASVLAELRDRFARVEAVHGNMDELELRAELPAERVVEIEDVRLGIVHDPGPAAGRAERLATRFPGCAGVVYGHTHLPHLGRHRDLWILNPGSPTERRRAPVHSMLVLEVDAGSVEPRLVELRA